MLTLLAAAALAAPQPGVLRTFGDWTVGCDNGLACQAVALVPQAADRDAYLLLVLQRGSAAARPQLGFALNDSVAPGKRYALAVDGRVAARGVARGRAPENAADVTLPLTPPMLAAMRNGRRIALAGTPVSASLTGLAATLLYMDDRQRRPAPPLPIVTRPAPGTKAPRTVIRARALAALPADARDCDTPTVDLKPEAHRLDATRSLVLIAHPCGNGAYNFFSTALLVDERGVPAPARFDAAPTMGASTVGELAGGSLVNADWDAATRTLGIYAKGRGIGDCGVTQRYAWDGARFRLVEQAEMSECRGSTDYITTWRARVVGRR